MGYGYFPILFHIPNVFKCNGSECLSVYTFGTVYELVLQTFKYKINYQNYLGDNLAIPFSFLFLRTRFLHHQVLEPASQ